MAAPRKSRRQTPRRPVESPDDLHDYAHALPPRRSPSRSGPASNQLERLLGFHWSYAGRPQKDDLSSWTVTDDWPPHVPVTSVEVDVFESWFGDVFDELFGPCH